MLAGYRQSGVLIAELAGVTSREAAAALRGAEIGVPRERLPALGENEHYQADLIGMEVVNRNGERLGTLSGFVDGGAHPIASVTDAGGVERLIPWVAGYVDRVDAEAGRIDVDWPADY
jgi:16S rRNA processing protein RimM